jgi:hypothetical protein
VAGALAAVEIVRARVVPQPWLWAPVWVLGLHVLAWVVPQLVFATVRPETVQGFADLIASVGALATVAGTFGLGILAMVLAVQRGESAVEVFRST